MAPAFSCFTRIARNVPISIDLIIDLIRNRKWLGNDIDFIFERFERKEEVLRKKSQSRHSLDMIFLYFKNDCNEITCR